MNIDTRVGLIRQDDSRYLGRGVFGDLPGELRHAGHLLGLALGAPMVDPLDHDALLTVAIATTSPDARVWPLKLTRVVACLGDPAVGLLAGQLSGTSRLMGPGAATGAAEGLCFVRERVAAGEPLAAAMADWRRRNGGRAPGFGVPFRPEDERLVALFALLRGSPLTARPCWQTMAAIVDDPSTWGGAPPNVVLPVVALLLDAGVPAARCGVALLCLMSHVFLASALEAAETDGPVLRELPWATLDDQVRPARHSRDREAG